MPRKNVISQKQFMKQQNYSSHTRYVAGFHFVAGSLIIVVSVDSQGSITSNAQGKDGLSIGRSSGNAELDRQALAIVRASAPFGPFPSEMRKQIDVLDWVSTFEFGRDGADRLELRN